MEQGHTLVSQQIRELVQRGGIIVPERDISITKKGKFSDEGLEKRVQPSSLEPTVGSVIFSLNTDAVDLFRPRPDEDVWRTFLQIPKIYRPEESTENGVEVRRGYTYVIPLREKINGKALEGKVTHIKSSPKSTTGRLFPKTRLIAGHNPFMDQINTPYQGDMSLWLIFQPLAYNIILHKGDTLNQLRFFNGDARLSPKEILEIGQPILYDKDGNPIKIEERDVVDGGLVLNLDLEGIQTQGIVGLKTISNPKPIDLRKIGHYDVEDFFEIIEEDRFSGEKGGHYLLSSKESVKIPPNISAELRRHASMGIEGRTHDAGFIDNGFEKDVVFEVSPDEESPTELIDGQPVSWLDLYRTSEIPDKLYGGKIGSNYQGQIGPKPSKQFKPLDFDSLARKHEKLNKKVLVNVADVLLKNRRSHDEFEFTDESSARGLFNEIQNGWFALRYHYEDDPLTLQIIPYVLVFDSQREIFTYARADEIKHYGEKKLFGKVSFGVGGHIKQEDGPDYIARGLTRELEEEIAIRGPYSPPQLVGDIFTRREKVDEVHLGLVYATHTNSPIEAKEKSLAKYAMVPIDKISEREIPGFEGREMETWTRILIPNLHEIYERTMPRG